jgi:hypothetical protein
MAVALESEVAPTTDVLGRFWPDQVSSDDAAPDRGIHEDKHASKLATWSCRLLVGPSSATLVILRIASQVAPLSGERLV